jgi:hypothetical protein
MSLAKAKQYALEMVKGIRTGYVPSDPTKNLHLETLKAIGERPLAGLAPLNLMGGNRHKWEHGRDRETLAEILRSECPMLLDVRPAPVPEPPQGDYPLEYYDDGYPKLPKLLEAQSWMIALTSRRPSMSGGAFRHWRC